MASELATGCCVARCVCCVGILRGGIARTRAPVARAADTPARVGHPPPAPGTEPAVASNHLVSPSARSRQAVIRCLSRRLVALDLSFEETRDVAAKAGQNAAEATREAVDKSAGKAEGAVK